MTLLISRLKMRGDHGETGACAKVRRDAIYAAFLGNSANAPVLQIAEGVQRSFPPHLCQYTGLGVAGVLLEWEDNEFAQRPGICSL